MVICPPWFDPPANIPLGGLTGVTLLLALLAALVPAGLVAVTVNVIAVPLVKLVTVIGELVAEADCPLEARAVKDETAKPPLSALAPKATAT